MMNGMSLHPYPKGATTGCQISIWQQLKGQARTTYIESCHLAAAAKQKIKCPITQEGCCFFPLRKCIFSVAATFWVAKLDFLCCWFFSCLGRFFSCLGRGFFPPRMVFSRCLQNAFFCCKGAFVLLQGVFSAALNFSRCEAAFFAGVFPAAEIAFSRCRAFFPAAKRVFSRSDVFFLLRTCVFRALREDKELENVESYTGRSPLVSWIAHGQIGDKGDQSLKQPSANEKLKHAALDAATCFNGSGYKRERQKE